MTNNVYVIGAGKLGCQIANNLSKEGFNVTIVDLTNEAFNKIQDFSGFTRVADFTNPSALDNFNLDNLILVSRAELLVMNRKGLFSEEPEITKTGANVAKLTVKINEINKKVKGGNKNED